MSRILMVDDDGDFLDATRLVLETEGFEVMVASSPEEGIAQVRSVHPDLVILDMMMPDNYEGFQVARFIRDDLKRPDLPIVVLSRILEEKKIPAHFPPEQKDVRIDVFLDKPVNPKVLIGVLRDLLTRKNRDAGPPS